MSTAPEDCGCPRDLGLDGEVGVTDFLDMLAAWGPNPGHPADFDGDGEVGVTDFLALLANWGACPQVGPWHPTSSRVRVARTARPA